MLALTHPAPAAKEKPLQTSYRGPVLAGMATILIGFGAFGGWASVAPLNSAVIAQGVVEVSSSKKRIQHLEGGIVAQILVKDGDRVEAGDILIRLDATRAQVQVEIIQGQLDAARALEARLSAERDRKDTLTFPGDLEARRADPKIAEILSGQEKVFAARRQALSGQIDILRRRVAQSKEQISGLQGQVDAYKRQKNLIDDELHGTQELFEKGYAAKTRLLALKREGSRLEGERDERIGEIARLKQSIGETELQIIQLENNMQEDVAKQIRDTQTSIFDYQERRAAAKDQLNRVEVRAPQSGTVVGLNVHTEGAVLQPAQTIMEIVPDADSLIINARMQTTDINNVAVGLTADVHFSAFKRYTTPVLTGTVSMVSADRIVDERTLVPYYTVLITVPENELKKLGKLTVVPGMPAEAYITDGERTAINYMISPLLDIIKKSFHEQ